MNRSGYAGFGAAVACTRQDLRHRTCQLPAFRSRWEIQFAKFPSRSAPQRLILSRNAFKTQRAQQPAQSDNARQLFAGSADPDSGTTQAPAGPAPRLPPTFSPTALPHHHATLSPLQTSVSDKMMREPVNVRREITPSSRLLRADIAVFRPDNAAHGGKEIRKIDSAGRRAVIHYVGISFRCTMRSHRAHLAAALPASERRNVAARLQLYKTVDC